MKASADRFKALDNAELQNRVQEAQDQIFRLKFQLGMGQMDSLKKYRELRRDRARMLGVLREREIDPGKAPAPQAGKKKGK
jgi:large subunit ribosomal protein L29